eukprot:1023708-Amphidinium_carterae.1
MWWEATCVVGSAAAAACIAALGVQKTHRAARSHYRSRRFAAEHVTVFMYNMPLPERNSCY